jgi:hypothetical protein
LRDGSITLRQHEMLLAASSLNGLDPDRLINGRGRIDVKRITSKRLNVMTNQHEFFIEWVGDPDTIFATWIPREWIERSPYTWGILRAFEEDEHLRHINNLLCAVQSRYRGILARRTTKKIV